MSLPQPYYQRGPATIYRGDCLELLPHLPRVDAVVTDPPYGIARDNHGWFDEPRGMIANDESQQHGQAVIDWAAANELPIAVFASPKRQFDGCWRNWIVWDKGGCVGSGGDTSKCLRMTWELIQVARNGDLSFRDQSVWRHTVTQNDFKNHPNEKPVALIERLIDTVFESSEVVVDPFLGSGTTAVAAIRTGRSCIGIELEERYCEIAAKRCDRELDQGRLPFDAPAKRVETQRELFAEVTQ